VTENDRLVITRARDALAALLGLTSPGGALAGNKHRGEVSSRAKWLRRALDKAEGTAPPEVDWDAVERRTALARRGKATPR
jgi:hypothetical protein